MALAFVYPGAPPGFTSTSNVATYTNTTFTFVSGTLYVVGVLFDDAEATVENPTSFVLNGATPPTVTQVGGSSRIAKFNGNLFALSAWWFIGDGVSRQLVLTQPDAGTGAIFFPVAVTGADNTNPIVQSNHNTGVGTGTASTTLASFADSVNNGAIMFVAGDAANPIAGEGGWTDLNSGTDLSHATPAARMSASARTGEDTSPSSTFTAMDWGIVAMEIAVAPAAGATYPGWEGGGWWFRNEEWARDRRIPLLGDVPILGEEERVAA